MYLFDEMIDCGLREGERWTSDDHRNVAIATCIANANVDTMGTLVNNVSAINAIPQDKIRKVTMHDLFELGCHL